MQIDHLQLLRCPQDHTPLSEAKPELIEVINRVIRAGQLITMSGKPVEHTLDGGLVRAAGDILYPIVEQIPVLLQDDAISLAPFSREPAAK